MLIENCPIHVEIKSNNSNIFTDLQVLLKLKLKKIMIKIYEAYIRIKYRAAKTQVSDDMDNIKNNIK